MFLPQKKVDATVSKHNKAKLEKDERNKIYALQFKKKKEPQSKTKKVVGGLWANWCRTKGHPKECNCAYPSRDEVVAASRHR